MASIVEILNRWVWSELLSLFLLAVYPVRATNKGKLCDTQGRMILNKVGRHKPRLGSTDLRVNTHVQKDQKTRLRMQLAD
jgi:hypothetical protein